MKKRFGELRLFGCAPSTADDCAGCSRRKACMHAVALVPFALMSSDSTRRTKLKRTMQLRKEISRICDENWARNKVVYIAFM
jgi:hypothetical protein